MSKKYDNRQPLAHALELEADGLVEISAAIRQALRNHADADPVRRARLLVRLSRIGGQLCRVLAELEP